jgi:hypothetical protein
MIDPIAFTEQMTDLQICFNVELDDRQLDRYYQSLNAKLDTEQFLVSCEIVFETVKRYPGNFPIVKDFVEAVYGTIEDQALKQWSLVAGKVQNPSSEDRYTLSALGKKALDDIGGIEQLRMGQVADMVWHEKRFIAAYNRVGRVSQRNDVAKQITGRSILELNGQVPKQLTGSAD